MNILKRKNAFTLTELLVAMGVFAIVIVIVVGIFIQALRSQRILNHLMAINDNTALVIEQAAREIRTGYGFCPAERPCLPEILNFMNFRGEPVSYQFDLQAGAIVRNGVLLTTPEALISQGGFFWSQGDDDADPDNDACNPWRISIFMSVRSVDPDIDQISRIQTTASSRVLPVDAPDASQELIAQCSIN